MIFSGVVSSSVTTSDNRLPTCSLPSLMNRCEALDYALSTDVPAWGLVTVRAEL